MKGRPVPDETPQQLRSRVLLAALRETLASGKKAAMLAYWRKHDEADVAERYVGRDRETTTEFWTVVHQLVLKQPTLNAMHSASRRWLHEHKAQA